MNFFVHMWTDFVHSFSIKSFLKMSHRVPSHRTNSPRHTSRFADDSLALPTKKGPRVPLLGPEIVAETSAVFKWADFARDHTKYEVLFEVPMQSKKLRDLQIKELVAAPPRPLELQEKVVHTNTGSPDEADDDDSPEPPLSEDPAPQQLLEWIELFVDATRCGRGGVVTSDPVVTGSAISAEVDTGEQKFDFEGRRYALSCGKSTNSDSDPGVSHNALAAPLRSSHVEVVRKNLETQHSQFYAGAGGLYADFEPNVAQLRAISDEQLVLAAPIYSFTDFACPNFSLTEDVGQGAQNFQVSERTRRRLRVRLLSARRYCADNRSVARATLASVSNLHNDLDQLETSAERKKFVVEQELLALPPGVEGSADPHDPKATEVVELSKRKSSVSVADVAQSGVADFFAQRRFQRLSQSQSPAGQQPQTDEQIRLNLHHKFSVQAQTDEALLAAIRTEAQFLGLAKGSVGHKAQTVVDNISDSLDLLPPEGMASMFRAPEEEEDQTPWSEAEMVPGVDTGGGAEGGATEDGFATPRGGAVEERRRTRAQAMGFTPPRRVTRPRVTHQQGQVRQRSPTDAAEERQPVRRRLNRGEIRLRSPDNVDQPRTGRRRLRSPEQYAALPAGAAVAANTDDRGFSRSRSPHGGADGSPAPDDTEETMSDIG